MRHSRRTALGYGTIKAKRLPVFATAAMMAAIGLGQLSSAHGQQVPGSSQVWSPIGSVTSPAGSPQQPPQAQQPRAVANTVPVYSMPSSNFSPGQSGTPGLINPVIPRSGPYFDPRRGNNPSIPVVTSPFTAQRGAGMETVQPESSADRQSGEETWSGARPTRGNPAPEQFQTPEPRRVTGTQRYPIATYERIDPSTGRKRPRPLIVDVAPVPATLTPTAPMPDNGGQQAADAPAEQHPAPQQPAAQPVPPNAPAPGEPKAAAPAEKSPPANRPVTKELIETDPPDRIADPLPPATVAVRQRPRWAPPVSPYDELPTASRPVSKEQADYDELDAAPGSGPMMAERNSAGTRR